MSKKDSKPEVQAQYRSAPREIVEVVLYALTFLFFINNYVWQNFNIPTESMENSLLIGDHLTVNTFVFNGQNKIEKAIFPFREIKRGDVVVFKYPRDTREDYIKRCIGLPGDKFEIINDRLYLNDELVDEPYAYYKSLMRPERDPENKFRPKDFKHLKTGFEDPDYLRGESLNMKPFRTQTIWSLNRFKKNSPEIYKDILDRLNHSDPERIPEGFYLMMGDNRNNSLDSRGWGLVPEELVQGRAWFVWWSFGEELDSHRRTMKERLVAYAKLPIRIFTRTRFKESFSFVK